MPTPPAPPPAPPSIYYPPLSSERESRVLEHTPTKPTAQVLCLNVIQNITQLCLGGVIISALIFANLIDEESRVFFQHIVLCTVGYFILMAQAIISFSPVGWTNNLKYESRKVIHGAMQVVGSILAISGSLVLLSERKFNFYGSHEICGFTAMIFTFINLVSGVLNLIFHQKMNKLVKILHLSLGALTITIAFVAIILAFHEYHRLVFLDGNANMAITIAVFALIGTIFMAFVKIIKQILE